eukprot:CAMPEP_0171261564 /NCGR_PEP_ID=MMETSP0790-20130122/56070_1 /TAXON_ID=2925 /ORGANISM="Alexandrium catenella, Strain OF101" /LENGTH=63 /DNA_ID=CAMNT_0011729997 /DNA_START=54 /DNA_END=245 /DNA_ORIENTATION=+
MALLPLPPATAGKQSCHVDQHGWEPIGLGAGECKRWRRQLYKKGKHGTGTKPAPTKGCAPDSM